MISQKTISLDHPSLQKMEHGWLETAGEIMQVIFGCLMKVRLWQIQHGYSIFRQRMAMIIITN